MLMANDELVHLRFLGEALVGKVVILRAWVQNVRMQGAEMVFIELREERQLGRPDVVAPASPTEI